MQSHARSAEINIIGFTVLCYLFRATLPVLKFPFILLSFGIVIYTVINRRDLIKYTLTEFVRKFYLVIILGIILLFSFLFSEKLYLIIFKDALNAFIILLLFLLMSFYIRTRKDLLVFFRVFNNQIIFFALLVAIAMIINSLNLFQAGGIYNSGDSSLMKLLAGSLSADYNFALIPVLMGLLSILFLFREKQTLSKKIFLNCILIVFAFTAILSGSRRGLITIGFIIILILFLQVNSFFTNNEKIKNFRSATMGFIGFLILIFILSFSFTTFSGDKLKNRFSGFLYSKNMISVKQKIAFNIFRYTSVITGKYSYTDVYNRIWYYRYDVALDPDCGWGTRVHKSVYTLQGDNAEIVPSGSIGYMMDKTSNASTWDNGSYSYTDISFCFKNDSAGLSEKKFFASVYCYVSPDFDGTWARISAEGSASGNIINEYNLSQKGTWQKLIISFEAEEGVPPVYLYWSKLGVTDFQSLNGYIIFAYPQYTTGISVPSKSSFYKTTLPAGVVPKVQKAGMFPAGFSTLLLQVQLNEDTDPVRRIVSDLISEDTTYFAYTSDLHADIKSNNFIGERVMRWNFALQIFTKEYNLGEKIFGGGFDFLNWYGYYFHKDKKMSDYPHNPFLSILLYSGILGLAIYLIVLFRAVLYYLKYIKDFTLNVLFFLIIFFFSFFSSGSPFDPPVMGFFLILPLFIDSIFKKSE